MMIFKLFLIFFVSPTVDPPPLKALRLNLNTFKIKLAVETHLSDTIKIKRHFDEDIQPEPEPDLTEPDIQDMISNITKSETVQEVPVPTVFKGAITRQRAKVLQHKFNESMILASDLGQVKLAGEPSLKQDELKGAEPVKEKQASSEDMWPFIPEQCHTNLMIITMEDQLA